MLHGARVDETPSARGSIAIESRGVARISPERKILKSSINRADR